MNVLPTESRSNPINALVDRRDLRKVAVIGAGTMGSGIAALLANAGLSVRLLDVAGSVGKRNDPAQAAIRRQLAADGFCTQTSKGSSRVGNIDDDLHEISGADWIVEAIVEDLDFENRHHELGPRSGAATRNISLVDPRPRAREERMNRFEFVFWTRAAELHSSLTAAE